MADRDTDSSDRDSYLTPARGCLIVLLAIGGLGYAILHFGFGIGQPLVAKTVPHVRGAELTAAEDKVNDSGLDPTVVGGRSDSNTPVCRQEPSAGTKSRGPVELWVNDACPKPPPEPPGPSRLNEMKYCNENPDVEKVNGYYCAPSP